MDNYKPFGFQILLLKLAGYQLHYEKNWRGFLLHTWGYCMWFFLGIGGITGLHCTISNFSNVVIFTEASAYTATSFMCFVRVTVFFVQRKRIAKLVENLISVTETGIVES